MVFLPMCLPYQLTKVNQVFPCCTWNLTSFALWYPILSSLQRHTKSSKKPTLLVSLFVAKLKNVFLFPTHFLAAIKMASLMLSQSWESSEVIGGRREGLGKDGNLHFTAFQLCDFEQVVLLPPRSLDKNRGYYSQRINVRNQ